MEHESLEQRLSGIETLWTLVRRAHEGSADTVRVAQEQLLKRYGGAVKRYLRGILRDNEAADDLFQEFSVRLIKGDLHGADPQRGRFRQFVKGVLFHLVADHYRRQKRLPVLPGDDLPEPVQQAPSLAEMDTDFLRTWREELLGRAWMRLDETERRTGKRHYTVLRFRAENPELSSSDMAEKLGKQMGKKLTAAGVRQTLHRAREEFADLVLDEVLHSLESPTIEQLEEELTELELIEYCRPALERKQSRRSDR